ncbi:MAG: ABC transporter substrate-binding protein [Dehalococcoidia bacterium]|nr:ABC transporter substrate-binding protein [Dehalococcoidia bacterium]
MTKHALATALVGVLVVVAFVGCGGDDSDAVTKAAPSVSASATTAAATTAAAVATTTSTAPPAKTRPTELKPVTVGYSPILIYAPIYLAIEKGYFADEGIALKLERVSGGADILTQTAAGNFDVGASGISAATFNAASAALKEKREVPFEVVSPIHFERAPNNTPLVVSKTRFAAGEITRIADLKGKKVAINALGSGTEYALQRALQAGGLTVKDVTISAMSFNDMGAALANKGIDAAMLAEPQATLAKDQNFVAVLNDTYQTGDASSTAIYWNRDWARKNPELAAGFLRAFLKAGAEVEKSWNDPDLVTVLIKYTNVPADVIKRASRPHFDTTGKVSSTFVRDLEAFFRSQGEITYEGDLDLSAFVRSK